VVKAWCGACCRILGENNGNLPKIVQIMAVVLSKGSSLADAETVGKMKVLLTQMQGSLPPQVGKFGHSGSPLSPRSASSEKSYLRRAAVE
jgi:hypothetical protein